LKQAREKAKKDPNCVILATAGMSKQIFLKKKKRKLRKSKKHTNEKTPNKQKI
jgi:hypothetical protein